MRPTVPPSLTEGCDAEDLARMREFSRGYARFVGIEDMGDVRHFRFESPKSVLEVPVRRAQ